MVKSTNSFCSANLLRVSSMNYGIRLLVLFSLFVVDRTESGRVPEFKEALASAIVSVERMTNIVNSTLDFVRTENMVFETSIYAHSCGIPCQCLIRQ